MENLNNNTASVKYLDLISQSAKDVELTELGFRAKEAEQTVNMRVLETEKAIFSKEIELTKAQRAVPYDIDAEMQLTHEIESLKKGLDFANKIKTERF